MQKWGEFEFNAPYEGDVIEKYLPDHIIIGSDGGGELYGIDTQGNYFNVPVMMDEEDIVLLGKDIELLPDEINSMWIEYE